MSTSIDRLVKAIQRIADDSPKWNEINSLLALIRKRGGIDGLYLEIGGASDQEYKDCCSDAANQGDPEDVECQSIEGDAPTDMRGGLCADEEWTDCATGLAINFSPNGFSQIETCKQQLLPDAWAEGYYWRDVNNNSTPAHSPDEAFANLMLVFGGTLIGEKACWTYTEGICTTYEQFYDDPPLTNIRALISRRECNGSTITPCTTDPELIQGDEWTSDSLTEYTNINGCFTASTCDTDASAAAKACNECLTICNNSGEQRTMCATADGGYILYDPTGINAGGKYDENGIRTELLPAGSTGGYVNGA